jgi:hypothetical protein
MFSFMPMNADPISAVNSSRLYAFDPILALMPSSQFKRDE